MAKTLSELIREISIKAGIKADDKDLTSLLANSALNAEVPDSIVTTLSTSLLSVDEARNNHAQIKPHYFKAAYDGLDKEVVDTMTELDFTAEQRAEIMKEGSSTKRATLLAKKVRQMERDAKKDPDSTPAELLQLRSSVNDLNAKLAESNSEKNKIKEKYEKKIQDIHKNNKLSTLASAYKTILDGAKPDAKMAAIMAAINSELTSSEALLELDSSNENLILKKKDGTNFHNENHVQVTPEQFIETALSKNNILLKNNAGVRDTSRFEIPNNNRGQQTPRTDNSVDNSARLNSKTASVLEKTLQEMESGKTSHAGLI